MKRIFYYSYVAVTLFSSILFSQTAIVSDSTANERAPFLISHNDFLYAAMEYEEEGTVSIHILVSDDFGENWRLGKVLAIPGDSLLNPYLFITVNNFYLVCQRNKDGNSDIALYYNNANLSGEGNYVLIESSEDVCVQPAMIISRGILSIAYFNLTKEQIIITESNSQNEFISAYESDFEIPDGKVQIDATSAISELPMFVYKTEIDEQDELVLLEKTSHLGWTPRYVTSGNKSKENPSIASFGSGWILVYQEGTQSKYVYKKSGKPIITENLLSNNSSMPKVGVFDLGDGLIISVFEKKGKVYKRITGFAHLPEWRDEVQLYSENIQPNVNDLLSLSPAGRLAGVLFSKQEVDGNSDIYFVKLSEFTNVLASPSDLKAVTISNYIKLEWDDKSTGEDSFYVYRKDGNIGTWKHITSLNENATSFTDTTVEQNTNYCYKIRALSSNAVSAFSNTACAQTPNIDGRNKIEYSFNVLLINTKLGDLRFNIVDGSLFEMESYTIGTFDFPGVFNSIKLPFLAIENSVLYFGDIANEDIFVEMALVFDFGTGMPPIRFNHNLFIEFWVHVYKLPNFEPVIGDYPFNEGQFFTYSLIKDQDFRVLLNRLQMSADDLGFAYIRNLGMDSIGIETINLPDTLKFVASHFSKFGGGKGSITSTTGVEDESNSPQDFRLMQNYPNPFNPVTVISYELKGTVFVNLTVYDLMGKEVITLVNEKQTGISYQVVWNGRNKYGKEASSGVYFYRLKTDAFSQTRKMILIR